MDIDFHYFATYAAARLAGYSGKDALVVATSAQMIDENGRHVLVSDSIGMTTGLLGMPDDFEIREGATSPALHTYRVQMTFQGIGDIASSKNDTLASIWPVYHFLPGNFLPPALEGAPADDGRLRVAARAGRATTVSGRWLRRSYTGSSTDATVLAKFRWLARPHSPMAIGLVNNCTDLIHDAQSEVSQNGLGLYLTGVSMHVFIDTWAHQDFCGPAAYSINGQSGNPSIAFLPAEMRRSLPTLVGEADPSTLVSNLRVTESVWKGNAPNAGLSEESNIYVGHGQVGHWPDHCSLVWQYQPRWSASPVTRANPIVYFDAFVHMIWALYCIKHGKQYAPFDLDERNLHMVCLTTGATVEQLRAVYKFISEQRSPWGSDDAPEVPSTISDIWDRDIFSVGRKWQDFISDTLHLGDADLPTDWLPGRSPWVVAALEAHEQNQVLVGYDGARSGAWFTTGQFRSLDFFRFNLAAKFHYRFVKQQLIAFGEKLLGDWPDGAAYADDLARTTSSDEKRWLLPIINEISALQRTETVRVVNEGLTLLLREIEQCATPYEAQVIIGRILLWKTDLAKARADGYWSYDLFTEDGKAVSSAAIGKLTKIHESLAAGRADYVRAPVKPKRLAVEVPTVAEWESRSSVFFARRSSDSTLVRIDASLRALVATAGRDRIRADDEAARGHARDVIVACDEWLERCRQGQGVESKRRGGVAWLRERVQLALS